MLETGWNLNAHLMNLLWWINKTFLQSVWYTFALILLDATRLSLDCMLLSQTGEAAYLNPIVAASQAPGI